MSLIGRDPTLYGLLAEFATAAELVAAVRAAEVQGYRKMEAYTPYPIPALYAALRCRRTLIPTWVLLGGLFGCLGGFFLQYYLNAMDYPLNVGGRPLNSWPAFIPVTFELTILCAVLTAMLSMFASNGLPQLDHPVFNAERFFLVTRDRYFLLISVTDPRFFRESTRTFLLSLQASEVTDVETEYPYEDL